ncbi:hypothetical protein FQ186_06650 [Pseudomonas sp. ANT_H14]|uniref:hypothetical protein n=1 Tax=unclassified Pseudomonas TaxID=196821 RepID=UPI0011ECDCB2|nr:MULTISPECIES: hypothetical protein [unclassified Pseudomonas]KAA0946680.1 hypothetical protein FQ182_13215 [Pseudomonas sp. ANT_H4]KAA0953219.1 hypothetical protein FQ186_06650 [Pseudomonas sp. ANT_H14]
MRIAALGLAVALLSGCTTPSDLLSGAPELSATTKKSPKAYALCVFPAWQDYRSSSIMSETADGYRVVAGSEMNGQTDDVLDIKLSSTGSAVKLYQRMAWQQVGRGDLRRSFNSCL